ncbi:ankyrin repeat domain-containing protein [Thermomonospora amylolytica]|uniref:ankyrin repeat domain-containing protein n=1 Tax=Thermomonospora amylolytica TaxID=1411117 RepID=UPI000E6CC168|nr:ankyrin repeat domain-containing protein [Thermomonospora amylolytica]
MRNEGPFPPREAASWRRARRYGVPAWMIERATERRLAGDWRGACAAAGIDVRFDLAAVARNQGPAVAEALEEDLRHLAPDLLRWHLPRVGRGRDALTPGQTVLLGPSHGGPRLHLTTPWWMVHGPQRLALRFGTLESSSQDVYLETDWPYCSFWRNLVHDWSGARHLWDVRHTHELLERCGGGNDRAPFHDPDGTPRPAPQADPGPADPAGRTEWVTALHDAGDVEGAFAAAGIELDTEPFDLPEYWGADPVDPVFLLSRAPLALTRLEPEIRLLAERGGGARYWIPQTQHAALLLELGDRLRVRAVAHELWDDPWAGDSPPKPLRSAAPLPEAVWRRLPDLDLLRTGFPPERLHPLVHEALFPRAPARPAGPPPQPDPPAPVRVRCQGAWHEVWFRDGALRLPHTAEEQRREEAMRAFGGAQSGCFAAREAWRSGTGRLPRALRAQRDDLMARVHHGDTPGVLALLDAGVDPHVRDTRGRTLLHKLPLLDHEALLPRLLKAGLDLEARDVERRTPLFAAVVHGGSPALVEALLEAGARIDTVGEIHEEEIGLYRLIQLLGRDDLRFLADRIEDEHPGLLDRDW